MQTTLVPIDTCQISLFAVEDGSIPSLAQETGDLPEQDPLLATPASTVAPAGGVAVPLAAGRNGGEVRTLPLSAIDPTTESWHLQRGPASTEVDEILDAIRATGVVEPIRVVRRGERFAIVAGVRRYHAAVRRRGEGGPDHIAALIVENDDPAELLRWTLLDVLTRRNPSYLEVGWGLVRLSRELEHKSGIPATQKALMQYLGLRPKSWKGRISESLATAAAMPERAAEAAADLHGCRIGELSDQPRSTLRVIRTAPADAQAALLDVLAESVGNGASAGPLIRSARASLADVDVRAAAAAAVAAGRPVSAVLPTAAAPASTAGSVTPSLIRARMQIAAAKCRDWLRVVLDRAITRALVVARAVRRRMPWSPSTARSST